MKANFYKACLNFLAKRDGLPKSEWRTVMLSDVMTIEKELSAQLPREYEEFLIQAGVGLELGGLAEWYHLDLSVSNNLVEANEFIRKEFQFTPPSAFLAVYDLRDGIYLGFEKEGITYKPEFYAWDSDNGSYEKEADSLSEFLADNIDCTAEELELVEEELEEELSRLIKISRGSLEPKFA
jgi:hypothetical protein